MTSALHLHKQLKGKLEIRPKIRVNRRLLSLLYTPGVGEVARAIARNKEDVFLYTGKGNTVAIVSDGSRVLGLGNLGPEAALPVMEGKALLFKTLANIDAFPLCLSTQDEDEIVKVVRAVAPVFGGINLEDISTPKCFEIEERLQNIGIPVMHDDQHGTALVIFAGLLNAARVVKKSFADLKVVVSGAGAAGTAIAKLLLCIEQHPGLCEQVEDVMVCDSKGILSRGRRDLEEYKKELARLTNREQRRGTLHDALEGADVFIGLSVGGIVKPSMIRVMGRNPIVFALANPVPEIMPADARRGGARVIATGRSDFPNQVNNVLAFPGVFRGALDAHAPRITNRMKLAAACALAACVKKPTPARILPSVFDKRVVRQIACAVKRAAHHD